MVERKGAFVGPKLRLARSFNSISQADLAGRLSVTGAFISQVESGVKQPSELMLQAFCDALGFDQGFFFEPLTDEFRDEECHFRKRATTPAGVRNRMLAHGTLFGRVVSFLDEELELPAPSVPEVRTSTPEEIELAAERCRMVWDLGRDVPIVNMMRVLENAGVVVTKFYADTEKVDAFSRHGSRPVVVLTTDKDSASRWVFDMAHEGGHLVMHTGMETGTPEREAEADRFASAFLLPRAGFVREFPRSARLDWTALFAMKRRWRVSVAAIVRRAFDLRMIDAEQYQRAYKYIYARGWHRGEPEEFERDLPELVVESFAALEEATGYTPPVVAQKLHMRPATFEQVTGIEVQTPASPEGDLPENVVNLFSPRPRR